jgi:proteic killer suppression protein
VTQGTGLVVTPHLVPIVDDILARLNIAEDSKALSLPGWNLHPLKGELKGFWSVKVTGNWRIIFSL